VREPERLPKFSVSIPYNARQIRPDPAMTASSLTSVLQVNLRRLLLIRAIVFLLQLSALLYARHVLALDLDYALLGTIFVVLALVSGLLLLRLRSGVEPGQGEFFLHLLADVAGLSLLLYFSGGASNPFVSYFLVPVTIAAATLHW